MVLPFLIPVAATIAAEVLPSLVSKIGGARAGEVAEEVVDIAATVAGIPQSRDPAEILERLRLDARAQAELRMRLAEIENREEERILEDRLSARHMALDRLKVTGGSGRANLMLGLAFVGLLGCMGAVVMPGRELGTSEVGLVTTVAGVLLKMVSDAFAFEFGSSQGSKAKDAQIARFQEQLGEVSRERSDQARRAPAAEREGGERTRERVFELARRAKDAVVDPGNLTFAERLRRGEI